MRRSPLLLVVLLWLVAGTAEAADHHVDVLDNRFEPATITVDPGDRVTWTNRGQGSHTVTADNGSFDSQKNEPFITPIRPFTQRFEQPGRYPYHCTFHEAQMKGVVIVRRASATSTTSSTTTTTRPSRTTSTLEPGGSAVTAPGETTTTTEVQTTTTSSTTTTTDTGLAAGGDLGDSGDDTATGVAAALASLLLLGAAGGTLFLMRKGQLA